MKYAEPLLSDLPGGAHVEEPKSVYVGGDHRVMADTGVCVVKPYLIIISLLIVCPNEFTK